MYYTEKKLLVDDHHINPDKDLDLHYWSVVLKAKPAELKQAVKNVGNSVADVKRFLHQDWNCNEITQNTKEKDRF